MSVLPGYAWVELQTQGGLISATTRLHGALSLFLLIRQTLFLQTYYTMKLPTNTNRHGCLTVVQLAKQTITEGVGN